MRRREWLGAAAAAAFARGRRRPNIVFLLTDDQGYGDLGRHGNPVIQTPNLDRLHGESVRFTDFHASPTCAPTRTALMTGRHEFRSGVTHTIYERERMSLRATTIAQVLKSAGYATGIFGKWHLGDAEPYQPGRRGFDEVFIHGCGGIGQKYPGTCSDAPGNTYFNPAILHNGRFEKTDGYCTDVFFRQATQWMDERRRSQAPFFAYIATNAPHEPLECPREYIDRYRNVTPNEMTARFFGMITNIDDNAGRLLERLKAWGIERDTVFVFMTDNGGTAGVKVFNAGMRGMKNTPYQGGTRVPAFFRWPGVFRPGDVSALTAHLDVFPTFAELAGARIPAGLELDGRSLVPLLRNHRAAWADRLLFTHIGRWPTGKAAESKYARCRVRGPRHSMVNMDRGRHGWELYDLQADPGESTDIAARMPELVETWNSAYDRWWDSVTPGFENEEAEPPKVAPYVELHRRQLGAN
ncbi:MAG: arylsulfatase [Acidobacteria bacterium]|nr:arylsulfatase [Acidobacteriota bacterium]